MLDRLGSLRDHGVKDLDEALTAVAAGDLTRVVEPVTQPIEQPTADDLGEAGRAVNEIRDRTHASIEA